MKLPDEEEFKAWLQYPVTKALMELLESKREALRRGWEAGSYTDYEKDGAILTNVANLGMCRAYTFVNELSFDDFLTEVDDEQRKRAEALRSSRADKALRAGTEGSDD